MSGWDLKGGGVIISCLSDLLKQTLDLNFSDT